MSNGRTTWIPAILLAGLLAVALAWLAWRSWGKHQLAQFRVGLNGEPFAALHTGMSHAEVLRILGDPATTYEKAAEPQFHADLPAFKAYRISGRVLIYQIRGEFLLVVWTDEDATVERVFLGGMGWSVWR